MIAAGRRDADRRLRVAVPKGALFEDSVRVLESAGLDVGGLADPGRQLIVQTDETEFVIAKPTDVPAYVAYGGADCGIAGRDVLVEAGLELVEFADLRFGACKFVVAGRERDGELDERYGHLGVLRVATKYPNIAQAHFDARGVQVELVKLNGNIELAPLIGIADVIVDITATGTTLRQNGLRVIEDVMPSTARFVGNPVAARIDERVAALADALADALEDARAAAAAESDGATTGPARGRPDVSVPDESETAR